ncbi:DNA polymerase [Brevundimonas sp. GN22]
MTGPRPIAYAETVCASNFSFLRGASHPKDLVLSSLLCGQAGLGLADRNSAAGVVRAWSALKTLRNEGWVPPERIRLGSSPGEVVYVDSKTEESIAERIRTTAENFKLMTGARLVFADGTSDVVAYAEDRAGWGRLTRLLTLGARRATKGQSILTKADLMAHAEGLLLIAMGGTTDWLGELNDARHGAVWLGTTMHRRGHDRRRLAASHDMAIRAGVPLLACNDVLYHSSSERDLQDVLTCIREGVSIERAGQHLLANGERHLKTPAEMARLFSDHPEALRESLTLLERCQFDLGQLKYEYPDEPVPEGWSANDWLRALVEQHLPVRYPLGAPAHVRDLIEKELAFIGERDLANYFLTIHDIVHVARQKGILCQGRGSAANSAVCYVLGMTSVDPAEHDVLFERFMSASRDEPPDIDVDFEHERREEIIQHIYERYGRERAGLAATVICYRPRSAIREVGKALGLTEDVTARLAGTQWGSWGKEIADNRIAEAGLDPDNPMIRRAVDMAERLIGYPRHLSQHVGGFVLTNGRLDEVVPIGNAAMAERTFIEWDKDDIEALGLMKVDVLALGMLTCIRKAFELIRQHEGEALELATVPTEQADVYDMLCRGDSIGVFQVESRAQINMLPRLRPRTFYDLVIQVAIVRPGPIQGDMVHPYLRRRHGLEAVEYASPAPPHDPDELKKILGKTLGVPLFQEQAMKVAMVAGNFSEQEANGLRKAMGTFRGDGTLGNYETRMVGRMIERGYNPDFAQRCFEQIKGFGSYGFPESHSASFAKLVYVSSYIKCRHPAAFACALLNSQPMGFYAPAQIVRDAREHGVEVRPIDVNHSRWDNTLEGPPDALALRLGMRNIDGFRQDWAEALTTARIEVFTGLEPLMRRTGLSAAAMRKLADADAFGSLDMDRREALWAVRRLPDDDPLPLFAAANARELGEEADANLPKMGQGEHVAADYQTTRLSLKAHPMQILRPVFAKEGMLPCKGVEAKRSGSRVRTAGVVLVRQRPGNGKAIFITLEDETGVTNLVLWERTFETYRRVVMSARLLEAVGTVEKSIEGVTHLMVTHLVDRTPELNRLSEDHEPVLQLSGADEFVHPQHPRNVRLLPGSRDFH